MFKKAKRFLNWIESEIIIILDSFDPNRIHHPGTTLKELMEFNEESPKKLANTLGIQSLQLMKVIQCKWPVSDDLAARLHKHYGVSKEFWLNMQENYDRRNKK